MSVEHIMEDDIDDNIVPTLGEGIRPESKSDVREVVDGESQKKVSITPSMPDLEPIDYKVGQDRPKLAEKEDLSRNSDDIRSGITDQTQSPKI